MQGNYHLLESDALSPCTCHNQRKHNRKTSQLSFNEPQLFSY